MMALVFWLQFKTVILQVRELAAASAQYCREAGGRVMTPNKDLVQRIASIGCHGQHPQNCERDLQYVISEFAKSLKTEFIEVSCRMWDPSANVIVSATIPMLDPVSLATALYKKDKKIFHRCFFGELSEDAIRNYWRNASDHGEWFQKLGASAWEESRWCKLAPLSIYGDDVASYRNTEAGNISILTFCSDLSHGNGPFTRYFLLSLYSEYLASEFTYSDLIDTWHKTSCSKDFGFHIYI